MCQNCMAIFDAGLTMPDAEHLVCQSTVKSLDMGKTMSSGHGVRLGVRFVSASDEKDQKPFELHFALLNPREAPEGAAARGAITLDDEGISALIAMLKEASAQRLAERLKVA